MQETMTDLTSLGLLSIAGTDAQKLLQGQLTCDLTAISAQQTHLTAHCSQKGRVITFGRLIWFQDQYLLQMPKELIPIALMALKKYAVFYKVNLQDVTDNFSQIGYCGTLLPQVFPELPQQVDTAISQINQLIVKLSGNESRYLIVGLPAAIDTLREKLAPHALPLALEQWKQLDIEAAIPAIYPETSEKFLPHELALPTLNAISFKKGCYTGQEIIARMEYRGKSKNQLFLAQVESNATPQRGSDVFSENRPFGSIVDYCQVGYNIYELLVLGPVLLNKDALVFLDREQTLILNIL